MTKLYSHLKKGFISILSLILILSNLNIINVNAENVQVSISRDPKVDIVLTTRETNLDLSSFENDIKQSLQTKGVDTSLVNIQTTKSTTIDTTTTKPNEIFNSWNFFPTNCSYITNTTWMVLNNANYYVRNNDGSIASTITPNILNSNGEQINSAITCTIDSYFDTGYYTNESYKNFTLESIMQSPQLNQSCGFIFGINKNTNGRYDLYYIQVNGDRHFRNYNGFSNPNDVNRYIALWKVTNQAFDYNTYAGLSYSVLPFNKTGNIWSIENWGYPTNPIQYNVAIRNTKDTNVETTLLGLWEQHIPLTTQVYQQNCDVYGNYDLFKLKVEVKNKNIKVYYGRYIDNNNENFESTLYSTPIISVKDNSYNGGNVGLFCVSNVDPKWYTMKIDSEEYLPYSEKIRQVNWKYSEDSYRFIVNVDDSIDTSLTEDASIISFTQSDKINFIQWGSNTNKLDSIKFIEANDNKGIFIDGNNYNNAIETTSNYIYNTIMQNIANDSQFVIVGEETNLTVSPAEYKNNAKNDIYVNGRWYIEHNYKYYPNNKIQASGTGKYTPDLMCKFEAPGEYIIKFDDKEVKRVYAHRLPNAIMNISINNNLITLDSLSFDVDSNEDIGFGKGIKEERWFYKEPMESTWTNGKLTTFDKNKIYLIKLEVEDFQGATSYTTQYVGQGDPVARFDFSNSDISKYEPLQINDSSYDPEGNKIINWNWNLLKDNKIIQTYNTKTPKISFNDLAIGSYTYSLIVTNDKGIQSKSYSKNFTIFEDEKNPNIIIEPQNCDWKNGKQEVKLSFEDEDSGFSNWRYAITTSQNSPIEGWSDWIESKNDTISISQKGTSYLHIQAQDKAGNIGTRDVGPYKIDNIKPTINNLTLSNDYSNITIDAIDEGSGIDGYAITSTNVPPNSNEYQSSNVLKTYKSGTYYVWVKDKVGLVSDAKSITINRKENVTISWNDNNNSNKLRPKNVTLTIFRNGSKLKDVVLDSTTTSYTFDNLDIMDSSGKLYSYTFNLNVNERYNVQVNGNTITASMKPTTFSVTIPKTISLNGLTGKGNYNVKVNGTFYYNDTLTVTPSSSFTLKDRSGVSTLQANVTQNVNTFTKNNLGSTSGSISLNKIKFAGKFNGTFNFNIKFVMKN